MTKDSNSGLLRLDNPVPVFRNKPRVASKKVTKLLRFTFHECIPAANPDFMVNGQARSATG